MHRNNHARQWGTPVRTWETTGKNGAAIKIVGGVVVLCYKKTRIRVRAEGEVGRAGLNLGHQCQTMKPLGSESSKKFSC